jgi:hypothetical protein
MGQKLFVNVSVFDGSGAPCSRWCASREQDQASQEAAVNQSGRREIVDGAARC